MAAEILKVGQSRVWMDPAKIKDIKGAITRKDIKNLIKKGIIKPLPEKRPRPKERRKRRRGPGSRKGSAYAKLTKKRRWIQAIRPMRRMLKELKDEGQIDSPTYRKLRGLIKGGMFRNRSHLRTYLEQHGIIKKGVRK
jgi:large subunit ribosomal protein L19e